MDASVKQMLVMMAGRRKDAAATKAGQERKRIEADLSRRGVLDSGFGRVAVVQSLIDVYREAQLGTLADYLSVAADIPTDDGLLDELEAEHLEQTNHLGEDLRNNLPGLLSHHSATLSPSCEDLIRKMVIGLERDAKIALGRERLRRRQPERSTATPNAGLAGASEVRDFFLSHAGEDRPGFVAPLAEELCRRHYTVWFSESELTLGDSLRARIDQGLSDSRFGVVVLSPAFFDKPWPRTELDALAAKAALEQRKVILPVRHELTLEELGKRSPSLAGVMSVDSAMGVPAVVDEIVKAFEAEKRHSGVGLRVQEQAPVPKPTIVYGSYQFEGDARLYCIRCYETSGRKHPTVRLNIHQRQCAVCQTVVSAA